MKKQDFIFIGACLVFFGLFFVIDPLKDWFLTFSSYKDWRAVLMAFLKFGLLSTLGEVIGLRIRTGRYFAQGFGLAPRAVVWGCLGVCISWAMTIFSAGTPVLLANLGVPVLSEAFGIRLLTAFCISVSMNTVFAPVFMTFHKITDSHIAATGGSLGGFFSHRINMVQSFRKIDWEVQWGFVFRKTIPLFWFPAHTLTFMLPGEFRVLFAALLGVALGLILSIASGKAGK
jgi:hypothetical protein